MLANFGQFWSNGPIVRQGLPIWANLLANMADLGHI